MHCRYLVAADGANSRVRGMLGSSLQGRSGMQYLVNIHFFAPGLGSALQGREAMLYFVFNPSVISVLVAHDISSGEFVAQASDSHHTRARKCYISAANSSDGPMYVASQQFHACRVHAGSCFLRAFQPPV